MISVIIPTFNEQDQIGRTIRHLLNNEDALSIVEVIITDGGSTDKTILIAQESGAITIINEKKGRAAQMNAGAAKARGDVLYFLHSDTLPPKGFTKDIISATQKGFACGCYQLSFDYVHWFLKFNCWFTRFDINAIRFGDQSLFVAKNVFFEAGGFNEALMLLEDQEIIYRIRRYGKFVVIKKVVVSSARKYLVNGIYRTQGIYFLVYFLYRLGFSQQRLLRIYKSLIRQDKL